MTKQKVFRLNDDDIAKLQELAKEYGSQAQAVRIAIRKLHIERMAMYYRDNDARRIIEDAMRRDEEKQLNN